MKKKLLLVVIFGFLLSDAISQRRIFSKIDSLVSDERYDEARTQINQATKASKDKKTIALLANKTAEILITQGKLDDAEHTLQEIKSQGDRFLEAVTQTNLGFLYLNKARNDLALENLQQALTKFQESGNANTRESARCLANLTLLYWSTGKLNQAEENGLIVLQIRQRLLGESSEEVAASYNDLGLVYSSANVDKALSYYEKAFTIYQKLHGKEHRKIAIASNNIGTMYRQLELYGDAVTHFETALAIWKKVYPNGHPNQASALVNLGLTYIRMGDQKAALGYFAKALDMYRQSYGPKHPDISSVLNQIGTLQLNDNLFDEALKSFQEALLSNSPSFDPKTIFQNPNVSEFYNGKVLLYSMRLKAQALESKYYGRTLKMEDLTQALSCLSSCDTLIDHIRHHSSDEQDKIELGESANEVYEDGVRIAQAISEMTIDFKHYREVAFYFAEKSKSAVLQESIAEAEAKSFAGIPNDLIEREYTLKATIAFLTQKLSQKPPVNEEKSLRQTLFTTNRQYDAFTKKLETDYPNYFNLKFNLSSPTVKDLQKRLDEKTAIVSYFIAGKRKRIYQFIITQTRFKVRNLTLPANFDNYAKGLTNGLFYNELSTYREAASVLSGVLIPAFPDAITNLVVIPSGRLGTVPFEALFYKKNNVTDYPSMPLVVKRFALSYEFSAGLLAQKSKSPVAVSPLSIFLCAPVRFPAHDNLADLPGTETEVNAIANLFTGNSTSVAKFSDASEDLVKSGALSKFNYLHFATHGIVDETDPELSRIYLQNGKKDDGNLFAGEIYNLRLHADLTVLSACQTGLGKFSKGEGVIGLSRALVYAGSKNIIVSFWSVADESTSQLMTDFYSIMLQNKNQNFRETLQKAKVKMINQGKYAAPYYWAPFVIIGF
jgi:CHAT domain-containing protein/Tfp pilus assembly protein PilF